MEPNQSLHLNPYSVPPDQHGWRGLAVPGNHKRKWYTVLHNDQVLVTALLLIPGETSIRHSHESGELSIHFSDEMRPEVTWNPPGVLHGGPVPRPSLADAVAENLERQNSATRSDNAEIADLVRQITDLQAQMQELQFQLQERLRPQPAPRVIVDILFPPFRTTIDDPAYSDKKTVTGQWFD
jgi:hypothetical protein